MTTALAKLAALHAPSPSQESGLAFARELEGCIRAVAAATAASAPYWADHCVAPSNKVAFQAQRLGASLSPVLRRHGYGAAHWCAFYAANMPHGWPVPEKDGVTVSGVGVVTAMCPHCAATEVSKYPWKSIC